MFEVVETLRPAEILRADAPLRLRRCLHGWAREHNLLMFHIRFEQLFQEGNAAEKDGQALEVVFGKLLGVAPSASRSART